MNVDNLPFVSIVVPALNEESYISECIDSLLGLDYPKSLYEIIVVDNGSVDGTPDIVRSYPVTLLEQHGVRVGAVRNYGVRHAKGDIVAFIDADCVVQKNWVKSAIDTMVKFDAAAVGGICLLRSSPSWVEASWVVNPNPKTEPTSALNGGSIAVRRNAFDDVGGFDERMNAGEDTDFGLRLAKSGFRSYMSKECAVIHLGYPRSIRSFMLRQIWHASSALQGNKRTSWAAEKINIVSAVFLVLLILMPFVVLYSYSAGILILALCLLMPAALTVRRLLKSRFITWRIDRYLTMYLIDFSYLLGRSLGLGRSALVALGIVSDKKSYY